MNRRMRARFKTDLTVLVTCLDLPGCFSRARLADLSAHGLSLILDKAIPVDSTVKVEWKNSAFVGKSVYCRPHGQEFLVGLKVDESVYDTAKNISASNSKESRMTNDKKNYE